MEKNFFKFDFEPNKENLGEFLGTLTFLRHSKTKYTEKYPDLTPEGLEITNNRADEIVSENEPFKQKRFHISSPQPRAQGTSDIIKDKFGDKDQKTHISDQIRCAEIYDRETVDKWFEEAYAKNPDDPRANEKFYRDDQKFEENPEIIEVREKVAIRSMRALEYLIRSFEKNEKPPHIIATSHFEIITPIISQIFFEEEEILFGHVEDIKVNFFKTEDSKKISMKVVFRGQEKRVIFDREKRKIIV